MHASEVLLGLHREGQRCWPSIQLRFERFEARFGHAMEEAAEPAQYSAADLYLSCACLTGDALAMETLQREASACVRAAIARVNRDPDFIKETLQELWGKLLAGPRAKLLEYSGRGSLMGWLRVVAARTALDRARAMRVLEARRADLSELLIDPRLGPESAFTKSRYRETFQRALAKAVAALPEQDRNVLRLHVMGCCSIDEIGKAYCVHRATAARWLDRARTRVFDSVRAEVRAREGALTDTEFASIARSMAGQLDLHLSQWAAVSDASIGNSSNNPMSAP